MRIENKGIEIQRAGLDPAVQHSGSGAKRQAGVAPSAPAGRSDTVQISDAGRALAAQQTGAPEGIRAELTSERIAEVRQRILEGAYSSVEMADRIARRMLERGDI